MTLLPDVPLHEPATAALVLLVSGHVLADFLVQTQRVADAKRERAGALLLHGLLTLVTHLLLLFPFWTGRVVAVTAGLGAAHLLLDAARARLERPGRRPLLAFAADQGLHALTLVAAWRLLAPGLPPLSDLILLPSRWLATYAAGAAVLAGLAFNGSGGTTIVRKLLERYPAALPASWHGRDTYAMGRTIGVLERLLVFVLVLLGQWGALGLVLAAKSIARFKELEKQMFADYYLIGTLTSLMVALVSGIAVRWVLG